MSAIVGKIPNSLIRLFLGESTGELQFQSKDLRGAIANLYPHEILFHQHDIDGSVKYKYPLIQYKFVQGNCLIVGIGNGAKLVSRIELVGKTVTLSHKSCRILKKDMEFNELPYGISREILLYSFLSPWLALNEKNYEKYQHFGVLEHKKALLEKILVGNILSMSKSLGYTVPAPIEANIINIEEVPTTLKGTPMLGFLGTFSVNFEIPDYWGIGKSVSRGFGTVKRVDSSDSVAGIDKRDGLM